MKRTTTLLAILSAAAFLAACAPSLLCAADAPADRAVVMYFHRTQRCPTCQKMGGYTDEAVKSAFAAELAAGTVELHSIDFQDAKNAKFVQAYGITGPTLIVAKVVGGKVAETHNLKDIWTKVRDKDAFFAYVQDNVKACLPK